MKLNNKLALLLAGAVVSVGLTAVSDEVQSYPHPSLFGTQTQEYSSALGGVYVTGATLAQDNNKVGFAGKENVLVSSYAKDLLNVIKNNESTTDLFNPKMPVLRSELAVVLAESFAENLDVNALKKYDDITDSYWAKAWIDKALEADLMIGYPDNKFRPDQPVTKAEVFATIAKIVDVNIESITGVTFKNEEIKYIPLWSVNATKEVIGSGLLEQAPDPDNVINDEYLSKEQVAYLISALKCDLAYFKKLAIDENAPALITKYAPTVVKMKMNSRVDAKHSNIGDKFTANTTDEVVIAGETFAAGSTVTGKVVEVQRPTVKEPGFIKVKFETISDKTSKVEFPNTVSEATVASSSNPNIAARFFGAPFSAAGRVVGIVGRSGGTALNVAGNRIEELGDGTSDLFVETLTAHPGSGIKSTGNGILSIGKGILEVAATAATGVFGILYEVGDELVYLILPSKSNEASLNPNEEIVVIF